MGNNYEEIKIEYSNKKKNRLVYKGWNKIKNLLIICATLMVMYDILKIFKMNILLTSFVLLMIVIIGIMMMFLSIIIILITENKRNVENAKVRGKKGIAKIQKLETYEEWYRYRKKPIYDIYGYDKIAIMHLEYEGKVIPIGPIRVNKGYRILKLLLEPYPIKGNDKICIDIYEYKNFIYVDLESLLLEKINGYEEARKLIEESIK